MIEIYVDIYLAINFFIDYVSLISVEKICLLPKSRKRVFIAAMIGSLYSFFNLIFSLPVILHIFTAIIMIFFVTQKKTVPAFFVFICTQLFIGGSISAIKNISSAFEKNSIISASILLLVSSASALIFTIMQAITKNRIKCVSTSVTVFHNGEKARANLMIDSGNLAREATTGRRVIFIKVAALGKVFEALQGKKSFVIPIDTTSGRSEVLGFIPDKLEFSEKRYNNEDFIIVPDITNGKFAGFDGIAPLI